MSFLRLLQRKPDGEIVFREPTSGNVPPAYAILSHTWGKEEVVFQDIQAGADMSRTLSKAGWRKIQFCADQAAADGLTYFWLDTCCIDKKNAVELGAAINSMFRWYQNAVRCYVYLSDVSKPDPGADDPTPWEAAFRKSRWFTRGWTLQELIAPRLVDFFSSEGERLGSKLSLESEICEITGIANKALQGDKLSNFSIRERRSWAESRSTTIEEDEVYCLIGIFDVSMVPNYGEGRDQAFRRLEDTIHTKHKGVDFEEFSVGLNLVSFPEAVQFVAREEELSKMYELLQGRSSRSCVVLHGLGGMGKTQLAVTYARRHKEKYTAIFWLNANDEDTLKLSFRDVAQQVLRHHPSNRVLSSIDQNKDLDQVVNGVKAWLDFPRNTRWLMIYDNLDNPRTPGNPDGSAVDIRQFLPRSDHGSIIITTRSSQVRQGERIHVQKLSDVSEGLAIVSNMSGRQDIENDPDAIALVKELDGLPLALSTAGAYLEHVTTSFSDYRKLYKASWLKLQTTSPILSSYEDRKLHTTWQITFDRIQQQNEASAELLKLWAYFGRQELSFDLLRHANSANKWIQKLTIDELNFNEAMTLLCNFGLVDLDPFLHQQAGSRGYSVHSCIHSWTVFVLNKEWDKSLARLALICVASEVPSTNEKHWWLLQRRLLQHVTRQALFIEGGEVDVDGLHWVFHNLGDLYSDQSRLLEAEKMYIRALQALEEALGPDHTSTLNTVHNLGLLYADQGKLAEAEKMYIRALEGCNLYANQGKLAEAEKMYIRALEGCEEALGPDHTSTLDTVNNIGLLYADQGKLAEAEKMYIRALQGYEEALGPDHTSTLNTVNNLGLLYANQGKLAEAEKMYIQALEGKEEALGLDHTSTLDTVNNIGLLYANQAKLAEAEKMYIRALQGKEEALRPDHISTLETVNNLGNLYANQGKLVEAEKMYIRALEGKEEALGPDHTSTLDTVNNLGLLYADQGKLAEAEKMYIRALQGYDNALSPELALSYLPAVNTMFAFGDLFSQTDRKDMAMVMYDRALSGYTTIQGPSSKWCRVLEDRLQALQVASAESKIDSNEFTDPGPAKLRSFRQKLGTLRKRLHIG
ncbi:putative nb-arc and tpr protein [Coleophoma cylindrospora]|uniref:Putative nb-arc and tpr protein n=1 Tax=Coleophoma cylindrospora TaxID=1849047 RepID=A0A3D8RAJ8_9HELO|nr:putative nb-arc and tpr protein [Coleophoma cylindrospora]